MTRVDPPRASSPGSLRRGKAAWRTGGVVVAILLLLGLIGIEARALLREWDWLQAERSWARRNVVIGFPNISPRISYAEPPANWFHDEGEFTYLWGGWDKSAGHLWFRVARGDLEFATISQPMGRDVFQAIDRPIIEAQGGPIWGRIPAEAQVVGLDMAGVLTAYPVQVLDRVQVVNDLIAQRPILVTYDHQAAPEAAVRVYEAMLDGQRVTMGSSGYYEGRTPLFYDRGSESLWKHQGTRLEAIGGPLKGRALRQLARPAPVAWGDWRWRNPGSRLLVGADRSAPDAGPAQASLEAR